MNRTQTVQEKPFDPDEWQKLYYRHQQQYIRHRLDAVNLLHQGKRRSQVCEKLAVDAVGIVNLTGTAQN